MDMRHARLRLLFLNTLKTNGISLTFATGHIFHPFRSLSTDQISLNFVADQKSEEPSSAERTVRTVVSEARIGLPESGDLQSAEAILAFVPNCLPTALGS